LNATILVALSHLRRHHGVHRNAQVNALVAHMKKHGWCGRPILAERLPSGGIQAWTGTHRIAAAKRAGITRIPCVLVDATRLALVVPRSGGRGGRPGTGPYLFSLPARWYDEDRADFMEKIGDVASAALLRQEVKFNAMNR